MKEEEIIIMSAFGLLVLGGLTLGVRQGARRRAQVAAYLARHGWRIRSDAPLLAEFLREAIPSETWTAQTVMEVEAPPQAVYLFGYQATRKGAHTRPSHGTACLAQRSDVSISRPITRWIDPHEWSST